MTKKSLARIERDRNAQELVKLKKDNKCWDDMQSLYSSFSQALVGANAQLNEVYRIPGILEFIPRKDEVTVALRGLSQDIRQFGAELSAIHSKHSDRTGGFSDEADMLTSIQVFEAYTNYQVRYDAVIMPTVTFLLEQAELALAVAAETAEASKQNEEAKRQSELVDPTVVTDVEIKNGV